MPHNNEERVIFQVSVPKKLADACTDGKISMLDILMVLHSLDRLEVTTVSENANRTVEVSQNEIFK